MRQPKVIRAEGGAVLASFAGRYFVLASGMLVYSSRSLFCALRAFGAWL